MDMGFPDGFVLHAYRTGWDVCQRNETVHVSYPP